jgi:hypothetical protein
VLLTTWLTLKGRHKILVRREQDKKRTDEALVLTTAGKNVSPGAGVARSELGRAGDGVGSSSPDKLDGVADRCVYGEGDVAEDTATDL